MATRFSRWRRRFDAPDESGSTLVTVLVVMLVLTVGGIAVAGLIMNTTKTLVGTERYSQLQGIIDAGIAEQTTRLETGALPCAAHTEGQGTSVDNASYTYRLECSKGVAKLNVTAETDAGKAAREAIFSYQVTEDATPEYGNPDSPIMLFGDDGTTFNSNNLIATNGPINVSIPRGSFACNTPFPGDLVVHGNITVQAGCKVAGNVISVTGGISGPTFIVGGDMLAYGNISLNTNSNITGSMYSFAGNISLGGSTVRGNAQAGGTITLNGSSILGNATAAAGITLDSNGKVAGNALAGGNISLASRAEIGGDAMSTAGTFTSSYGADSKVAGSVSTGGTGTTIINGVVGGSVHANGPVTFNNFARVLNGSVTAKGDVDLGCTTVNGTVTIPNGANATKLSWCASGWGTLTKTNSVTPPSFPAFPKLPTMPTLPGWFEYQFKASDWPGYTVVTLKNSPAPAAGDPTECKSYNAHPGGNPSGNAWFNVKNLPSNTVIDARACDQLTTNMGLNPTVELSHNLVLLAPKYDLTNSTFKAAPGAGGSTKPGLWILKSDENPSDGVPSCAPAGNTVLNNTQISDSLRTMIYTPCVIEVNASSSLTGQLYGGRWGGSGGAGIKFGAAEIGLPGMSSTPGTPGTPGGGLGGGGTVITSSFNLISAQDVKPK